MPAGAEIVATGIRFPEGPVWCPDGTLVCTSVADGSLERVHLDSGRVERVAVVGGGANAAQLATDGGFIVTQNGGIDYAKTGLYGDDPLVSDGALAIGLAIAIAIVALVRLGARGQAGWRRGVAIAGGLGLITVAIWHGGQLAGVIAALQPPASGVIGPGIGVVGFGGALALIGGLLPGRPARLATDFLTVPSTPFQVVEKKSRRSPFARG